METIKTSAIGDVQVFIQGKVNEKQTVVMTVHDLGVNHNEYLDFLKLEDMASLASKCTWIHVIVPGQDNKDETIVEESKFPTLDQMAVAMGEICDSLSIKGVVLFGEGAGANICTRFCIAREDLIHGAILINCTASNPSFLESIKDKVVGFNLNSTELSSRAEIFLLNHRFGTVKENEGEHELRHIMKNYKNNLKENMNPKNLNLYIHAFMSRKSMLEKADKIKCPILIICGETSINAAQTKAFYTALCNSSKDASDRKSNFELIHVDGVANVIRERPEKVAEYILYFIQGLGLASGLVTRRMSTYAAQAPPNISMEDFDRPKGPDNITYQSNRKYSNVNDAHAELYELGN